LATFAIGSPIALAPIVIGALFGGNRCKAYGHRWPGYPVIAKLSADRGL